jgi:hypothetical protein
MMVASIVDWNTRIVSRPDTTLNNEIRLSKVTERNRVKVGETSLVAHYSKTGDPGHASLIDHMIVVHRKKVNQTGWIKKRDS